MRRKLGLKILISSLILIVSILHYISNTNNSTLHQFYKLLYFIPVILASFSFGFKGGTVTALIISVIYSPQRLLSVSFTGEAVNELFDILLFFAVGIITGILVEKKNIAIENIDAQLKKYVYLENYSNSIFESIRVGIVSINKDFFITSLNTEAKKILGIGDASIGSNLIEIFTCCKDIEEDIIKSMNSDEAIENIEKNYLRENKDSIIKIDIYPLSLDNKTKGLVLIIEDITEIKKMKAQMQRNDKLASLGQLATGIAHEIRNPLAIIKMIEQTMRAELKDNNEAIKELGVIDEEVERANKVIKALMEFGKPSRNYKDRYSLNAVIEEVLIIINKYASQHNVTVNFDAGNIPDGEYDKEQLKQVFVNLTFNAVDAMPDGGTINISTEALSNSWIKVAFRDTGKGIEPENLEKVFEPFFTTKAEGTGLGLPIVHRVIEDHEGVIKVESKPGKGTTFEILFPVMNHLWN